MMCMIGAERMVATVSKREPVYAYRVMKLDDEGRVRSMHKRKFVWGTENSILNQEVKADARPGRRNQNGLWAFYSRKKAEKAYQTEFNRIVACVAMWGRVAVHVSGIRAQYAKVVDFRVVDRR